MAKKFKLPKGFGFPKIMAFLKKGKERDRYIEETPLKVVKPSLTNVNAELLHPKNVSCLVTGMIPLGEKAFAYILEHDDAFPFFRAGQYVNVHLRDDKAILSRPISIISSPLEALDGHMMIAIGRNAEGYFSAKAEKLIQVGKPLEISAPSGQFYYSSLRDENHVIAVAGGIGITPFISMARAIKEGSEDFLLTIIYCAKSRKDAIFLDEIAGICANNDKLNYLFLDESKDQLIKKDIILENAGKKPYSLFVCGPQGMYNYLDQVANELGLDERHYRKEIFGSVRDINSLPEYPGCDKEKIILTIHCLEQTYRIEALTSEPILYALERIGIASPQRCRGGVCGYCRGKIIQGEVFVPSIGDGRRSQDKKKGYAHLCMTYPLSDCEILISAN